MTNLETYGDLKKLINIIKLKQKGQKIISKGKEFALDQVLGLIPGASNAKTAFDFLKTAISKPDTKKTNR
jgi:glycerol-3-phosphate responsive antiterminator